MAFKTTLTAKAQLLQPGTDKFKAVASHLTRYGFDMQPQMDLMYMESCLVSAGERSGVNDNDDIFTREEAWAARETPVMKPFNWQHMDKDIVGVMYSVQARTLDGKVLDIGRTEVPEEDFDLWTEAVVFKLIYPERAADIEKRAAANTLFVSMEAWFDDYQYGLYDDNKELVKTVARNESTSFLEDHLRVSGGTGRYVDPEIGQEMRIGRVLRSITFGGCGFVDRPANKRSVIDTAQPMNQVAQLQLDIESLLERVTNCETFTQGKVLMSTNANEKGQEPQDIKAAVGSVLDERDAIQAKAAELTDLKNRAEAAELEVTELKAKVEELVAAEEVKATEIAELETQLKNYEEAVDGLVKTEAGASGNTPAEIASIDSASSGDAAFTAKLAWLEKSRASMNEKLARADELETQLAAAQAEVRDQDVRSLLGEHVSAEALELFVTHASGLDTADYACWRDQQELMLIEVTSTEAAKKPLPPFMKKGKEKDGEKEEMKDSKANVFEAFLTQLRAESGANPDTMNGNSEPTHIINSPSTGDQPKSGVNPGSLKTPIHKIAGSAGNDPEGELESAQAADGINLAGTQSEEGDSGVSPFRTLASLVAGSQTKQDKDPANKPGFDPVQ